MTVWVGKQQTRGERSLWVKMLSALGTVVAVVFVGFFGMGMAAIPPDEILSPLLYAWHMIGFFAAPFAALLLVLRMRYPELTLLGSAAFTILLPISPFGPAIALTWVIARAPRAAWAWAIPLGAVSTALPLWRDWNWQGQGSVFVTTEAVGEPFDALSYTLMWVTLFALSLAGGWVRFYRGRATAESATAEAHRAHAELLQDEIGRQEERDLIAREMHDTVAHHLSLVSLHAGALEVTTTDDTVPQVARAVRENAHLALEEMRGLISSLRDSAGDGYAGGTPHLSDWEELVAATQTAGIEIRTDIQVDTGALPPTLARASYRILQESITNATKHSLGSGVSVQIWGKPKEGVHLVVMNWLPDPSSRFGPPGRGTQVKVKEGGAGILGMTERARALGGSLTAGPEGDRWVVRSWMPWT